MYSDIIMIIITISPMAYLGLSIKIDSTGSVCASRQTDTFEGRQSDSVISRLRSTKCWVRIYLSSEPGQAVELNRSTGANSILNFNDAAGEATKHAATLSVRLQTHIT